jgi:hypothetical protein
MTTLQIQTDRDFKSQEHCRAYVAGEGKTYPKDFGQSSVNGASDLISGHECSLHTSKPGA